jgi:hypothetical protein
MRIAIIGWGSLIWDARGLPIEKNWRKGGPRLPLEFSRVSRDGRLTLVVDYKNGAVVETYYALSARADLDHAVGDLAEREGTTTKHIGLVDLSGREDPVNGRLEQAMTRAQILSWLATTEFDAAVWTALESNFESKTGRAFSVKNAIEYVEALAGFARERALDYFKNAPPEIDTPLRRKLRDLGLTNGKSTIHPARQP